MGRLVRKSDTAIRSGSDASGKQGSLLAFLRNGGPSRKPLADARLNEAAGEPLRTLPMGKRQPNVDDEVGATAAKATGEDAGAGPPQVMTACGTAVVASASVDTIARTAADARVKLERAVGGWARLFASCAASAGHGSEEACHRAAVNLERTARSISSLATASYEYRVAALGRERRSRPVVARWPASLRARQYHSGTTGRLVRGQGSRGCGATTSSDDRALRHDAGKRTLEMAGHALMLDRLAEVGVCTLPRNPNEGMAVSNLGDPVISITYDPSGRFLASASAGGLLAVQSADTLRVSEGQLYEPHLQRRGLGNGGNVARTLSSIAWSCGITRGGRDNVVATVSGDSNTVEIVDVFANRTASMLSASSSGGGGGGGVFSFGGGSRGRSGFGGRDGGDSAGLLDVAFVPGEGNRVLASGRRGCVYLWDDRCSGGRPRAELSAPSDRSPVNCVRACVDGQTVLAGTKDGCVHIWDVRGGTKARAAAFSVATQAKVSHALIRTLKISDLLTGVPALREGAVGVGRSAVHWCEQDPHDIRRLGFHLACGWSGVVDLAGRRFGDRGDQGVGVESFERSRVEGALDGPYITHAHCPPPPWEMEEENGTRVFRPGVNPTALLHRRSAAWVTVGAGGGGTGGSSCAALAVGCPGVAGLRLLDFSPAPTARHWRAGLSASDLEDEEEAEAAAAEAAAEEEARAGPGDDDESDAMVSQVGVGHSERTAAPRRRRIHRSGQWWPDDPLATSGPALAVAAHPWAPDQLVAGSWGTLSLVGHR